MSDQETHEVNTESFNITADSDEYALAAAEEIMATKEIDEDKYRLELGESKTYHVKLYQTVDGPAPTEE